MSKFDEILNGFKTAFNPYQWVIILALLLFVGLGVESHCKQWIKEAIRFGKIITG